MIHRIGKVLIAMLSGNALSMILQVISVPVFLNYWGVAYYGEWVLLYTIPAYMALSDLGLAAVSINDIQKAVASGDTATATNIFHTTLWFLLGIFSFSLTLFIFFGSLVEDLSFGILDLVEANELLIIVCFLLIDSMVTVLISYLAGGFRILNKFHFTVYFQDSVRISSLVFMLVVVVNGGDILSVIIASLGLKIGALILLVVLLARLVDWMFRDCFIFDLDYLRKSFWSSGAYLLLPISNMFYLNVSLIIVGIQFGPSMVALYSSIRTMTRFGGQVVGMIGKSLWSEINLLNAKGSLSSLSILLRKSIQYVLLLCVIMLIGYYLTGQYLFQFWLGDAIELDLTLMHLLALSSAFLAYWASLEVFLLATNKHVEYARIFFILNVFNIVAAWLFSFLIGIYGVALAACITGLFICLKLTGLLKKTYLVRP